MDLKVATPFRAPVLIKIEQNIEAPVQSLTAIIHIVVIKMGGQVSPIAALVGTPCAPGDCNQVIDTGDTLHDIDKVIGYEVGGQFAIRIPDRLDVLVDRLLAQLAHFSQGVPASKGGNSANRRSA